MAAKRRPPSKKARPPSLALLQQLPLPVFYTVEEKIDWVNDAGAALLGAGADSLRGRSMWDFAAPVDRPKVQELYWAKQTGGVAPRSYEAKIQRQDGSTAIVDVLSIAVAPRRQLAVVQDISHRMHGKALVSALSEIALEMQRTRTVQAVIHLASKGLASLGLRLILCRLEANQLVVASAVESDPVIELIAGTIGRPVLGWRLPLTRSPIAQGVLAERRTFFREDLFVSLAVALTPEVAAGLSGLHSQLLASEYAKGVVAPIWAQDRPWGVACLAGRDLSSDDAAALSLFAAQMASAIEVAQTIEELRAIQVDNARLYSEARRRVDDLSLINELSLLVAQHLDLKQVLDLGVRHLAKMAHVPHVVLSLTVPGKRRLRTVASNIASIDNDPIELSLDETSTSVLAVKEGRPVISNDAVNDPLVHRKLLERFALRAVMSIPLVTRGEAIGAVFLGSVEPGRKFTEAEAQRILIASTPLAVAIANARLYEDVKRGYDSLTSTQKELVKRERLAALGELAAVVAHEVRNPLAVIFNSLGSIKKIKSQDPELSMLLGIVGEEADRLNRIVGDLLDFARPHEPNLQPESLESLISGALEAASKAVDRGRVKVELDVSRDLPPVPADARLLRQAFINLVVNALQATAKGGRVRLAASPERDGAQLLARVDVSDDGPGIPAALADQIFQPFFTTKATGTGLGLAVVKRIVEAHRGQIGFTSAPGRGTTFTVRLPV